jgi:hypothetical protein
MAQQRRWPAANSPLGRMSFRQRLVFAFLILIGLAALLLDAFTTFHWGGAIAGCIGIVLGISSILLGGPARRPEH